MMELRPGFQGAANMNKDIKPNKPTMFTLFPQLPFELRLKVYGLLVEPRVYIWRKKHHPNVPPILHICRESRNEGLRTYTLIRCNGHSTSIYMDINRDILFLQTSSLYGMDQELSSMLKMSAIEAVHHLAISRMLWDRMYAFPEFDDLYVKIRSSEKLETVVIVRDGGVGNGRSRIRLVEDEEGKVDAKETPEFWDGLFDKTIAYPGWNCPELSFARAEEC